mmetsp:Transcript_44707/g.97284  ORF Transcript_44707/g.97284 Transcript_44707/m.97284 type:complete len:258 (-) Transcript_44707:100-873(-)
MVAHSDKDAELPSIHRDAHGLRVAAPSLGCTQSGHDGVVQNLAQYHPEVTRDVEDRLVCRVLHQDLRKSALTTRCSQVCHDVLHKARRACGLQYPHGHARRLLLSSVPHSTQVQEAGTQEVGAYARDEKAIEEGVQRGRQARVEADQLLPAMAQQPCHVLVLVEGLRQGHPILTGRFLTCQPLPELLVHHVGADVLLIKRSHRRIRHHLIGQEEEVLEAVCDAHLQLPVRAPGGHKRLILRLVAKGLRRRWPEPGDP